jgi:outer membrane protein TolC
MRAIITFLIISTVLICGCQEPNPFHDYQSESVRITPVQEFTNYPAKTNPATFPDEPLDLEQAIRIGIANNPGLSASDWDIETARAEQDIAKAELLPRVNAVAGYTHYLDDQRLVPVSGPGQSGTFSDDVLSGDLVLTMPLFTAGRLQNQVKAREFFLLSSEHKLVRNRQELVFNISSVFHSILAQRKVIESLEFSQKALTEHRRRVEQLIEAQKAAQVDLLRTEVRLADVEQQLISERNTLDIQHSVLAELLGAEGRRIEVTGQLQIEPKDIDFQEGLRKAYAQRPDLISEESKLKAQDRLVDSTKAQHWPQIDLQAAYGGRWAADSTGISNDVGSVGVVLTLPIFEGGRIDATIRREQSRLNATRQRTRALGLQIQQQVQSASSTVESNLARIKATEKSIEQAEESLRIESQNMNLAKGRLSMCLIRRRHCWKRRQTITKCLLITISHWPGGNWSQENPYEKNYNIYNVYSCLCLADWLQGRRYPS